METGELTSEKLPLGALQVELVAPPPILPVKVTVDPEQMACGPPALTVGARLIVSVIEALIAPHGPAGSLLV